MDGSLSATLQGEESSWVDERELETGVCASYAIMPIDRAGKADFLKGKVTQVDGIPGLTCGDSVDPTSEVSGLRASVTYNNDTACYELFKDWNRCYELSLSWTWPSNEPTGNITWMAGQKFG